MCERVYFKYRYEMIEFLRNRYPQDTRKFHTMKIPQLRVIVRSIFEKHEAERKAEVRARENNTNNSGNPLN